MSTRNKKSSDNTHKLNRVANYLKLTAALIILLTAFPGAQRVASTQGQTQDPDQKPMQIELIDGNEVVANEAIVSFSATDELQRQTFVDNAVSLVNASEHRRIGPDNLNMFHIRSNNMNTRALVNMLSRLAGVQY